MAIDTLLNTKGRKFIQVTLFWGATFQSNIQYGPYTEGMVLSPFTVGTTLGRGWMGRHRPIVKTYKKSTEKVRKAPATTTTSKNQCRRPYTTSIAFSLDDHHQTTKNMPRSYSYNHSCPEISTWLLFFCFTYETIQPTTLVELHVSTPWSKYPMW